MTKQPQRGHIVLHAQKPAQNRLDRLKNLQDEMKALEGSIVLEWLEAQANLIRLSREINGAKNIIHESVREIVRTMLPELQSKFETAGQIAFKTVGVSAPSVTKDV